MTRAPLRSPWTEEQDALLKTLVAQGASVVKAAGALKRSITGVRVRASKIGSPFPPLRIARRKWTPDKKHKSDPVTYVKW